MENMRTVHTADAVAWLESSPILEGCSLLASMPDISEFPQHTLQQWKEWFTGTAKLILSRCPDDGVTLFYQSDIKIDGVWIDKGYMCQKAAESLGLEQLWHKAICRVPPGTATYGKPSYTHLLCFSKNVRLDPGKSTADIVPEVGDKTWQRGMGFNSCMMIAKFLADQIKAKTLVHPFCGEGGMLAAANFHGIKGIGIERSPKRADKARRLRISSDGKNFEDFPSE